MGQTGSYTEDTTPAADDTITTLDKSDTTDAPTGTTKQVELGNLAKFREVIKITTSSLTSAECSDTVINNYGQVSDMTQTLPTAAAGLKFVYTIGTAAKLSHLKAGALDYIILNGTALDVGDKVSNNGALSVVGEQIVFYTFKVGVSSWAWIAQSITGVFFDGGA